VYKLRAAPHREPGGIAFVVPVFRHSVLVFEAIASLLAQTDKELIHIIVVDDGCPHEQTVAAGVGLAMAHPNIYYIRQANRGLSAARNRGVDFVLANLPGCDAIFFLDADNMLLPYALGSLRRALVQFPDADWFYPDIINFGLEYKSDYSGRYAPAVQVVRNICEAGSLVRTRVFEAGTRFDENMKLGYEDWDFWLSAVERGFRGQHLPGSGFRYRRRPESMLSGSTQSDAEIRGYMERKHKWTRDPLTMVQYEHKDAPRFAIWLVDRRTVVLTSDPQLDGEELSLAEYQQRFWASMMRPNVHAAGAFFVTTTAVELQELRQFGLARWAFWDSEIRLENSNFSVICIDHHDESILDTKMLGEKRSQIPAAMVSIRMKLLRNICCDSSDDWIAGFLPSSSSVSSYHGVYREIGLPRGMASEETQVLKIGELINFALGLRANSYKCIYASYLAGRALGTPDLAEVPFIIRKSFGGAVLPPFAGERHNRIAFVVPIFEFGGVEKSALWMARELKKCGYLPCLVLLKRSQVHRFGEAKHVFDEIYIVEHDQFENWEGPEFHGTHLTKWSVEGDPSELANLLSIFDVVINCHAADMLPTMNILRRRGVITVSYLHLFDRTQAGRPYGHPNLAVAYEHVHDFLLGCSHMICAQLRALGVPAEKVIAVPNAPACAIDPMAVEATMLERLSRASRPLQVLFLGRLDYQKGLDRLVAIIDKFKDAPDVAVFRVVGKAIIMENETSLRHLQDIVEPPVYEDEALSELYRWADVVLLPSRYEGLPLTILEAMAFGAVPISAEAGAIAEVIENDVNGMIVSQDDVVRFMVEAIRRLANDRPHLMELAERARQFAAGRTWDSAVEEFVEALDTLKRNRAAASTEQVELSNRVSQNYRKIAEPSEIAPHEAE
jgi:glycosyltransferase involved in cell wall biosynthesis